MHSRFCRFLAAVVLAAAAPATVAGGSPASVDGRLRLAAERGRALSPDGFGRPLSRETAADAASTPRLAGVTAILTGTPDPEALEGLGIRVRSRAGAVLTASVPLDAVPFLSTVEGLASARLARPLALHLDAAVVSVGVDGLRTRNGDAWSGHTGAGVIVGLVDSAIDTGHEDFQNLDGTTRVLAYWGQADDGGTPPAGYGYGSAWDAAAIDAGDPVTEDIFGHGTHVASIAAGNGRASDVPSVRYAYAGIAPEADLVVVAGDGTDAGLIDGLNYIFDRAAALGKPAVVNLSLGGHSGPHDGTSPLDRAVDALTGPGRLVVCSAGNDGDDAIHAEVHPPASGADSAGVALTYAPGAPVSDFNVVDVDAFYSKTAALAVTVVSPSGKRFGPYAPGAMQADTLTGEGTLFLAHFDPDPESPNREIQIEVSDTDPGTGGAIPPPAAGVWRVVFENPGAEEIEVDLWISFAFPMTAGWMPDRADPTESITSPGTAVRAVTVGAYNTKRCWPSPSGERCTSLPPERSEVGDITFVSSSGPTRDGRKKPELVAPGFIVTAARSSQILPLIEPLLGLPGTGDLDGRHMVQAGTSMSAPMVSGALALLLAHDPLVTPEDARDALIATVRRDAFTGNDWDPQAGFGKLDVAALVAAVPVVVRTLTLDAAAPGVRLSWSATDADPVAGFTVQSRDPGATWTERTRRTGAGPHVWTDAAARPGRGYRLVAHLRTGGHEPWAEAVWDGRALPFALGPPAPNPSAAGFTVPVAASGSAEPLAVTVVDAAGRVLRRWQERSTVSGILWDGADAAGRPVPAGVYWMRVRQGSVHRAARLVRLP